MEPPAVPNRVATHLGPPPAHNPAQAAAVLANCYSLVSQQALDVAFGRESEARPEQQPPIPAAKPAYGTPSITSMQVSLKSIRE